MTHVKQAVVKEVSRPPSRRSSRTYSRGRGFLKSPCAAIRVALVSIILCRLAPALEAATDSAAPGCEFQTLVLEDQQPAITVNLAWCKNTVVRHSVILMLGVLESQALPSWSTNLVREGFMLAAFTAAHPADPDPERQPVWLCFDERFAHSYAQGGARAIADSQRVVEYLAKRPDVASNKIGWLGSSSTAIPGLAVVTQGPRLAAFVGFVCTGAYEQWFDTWREHGLWRSGTNDLWPETRELLNRYDPIRHATNAFPTALLMVSGGADKVVDPRTARTFAEAARPAYASTPDRLRLVVYDGFGHNLPADVVRQYAEHWFRLYLNPTSSPPAFSGGPQTLDQSVKRSQINVADHRRIVGADADTTNRLGWIEISADKRGFVDAQTASSFSPWGLNYDRDYKMRLLEDYWEAEWQTVVEDFREMKALGVNVVRIHLQVAKFMGTPDEPNAKGLAQLDRLLRLAENTGLHLDLTGLGCYRKADVPAWFDALSEAERWKVQAAFWAAIARTCAESPAVFCFDLINEPFVPAQPRKPGDWLAGELAGFSYVQALTLDPAGRPPHEIARQWAEQMIAAIRQHDRRHLITLGFLPISGAKFVQEASRPLDFVSVHLYPKSGEIAQVRETLRSFQVGKPLVVEEIFPLHCRGEELVDFIREARDDVAGWITFYWGQTPEQLAGAKTIGETITREWLKTFRPKLLSGYIDPQVPTTVDASRLPLSRLARLSSNIASSGEGSVTQALPGFADAPCFQGPLAISGSEFTPRLRATGGLRGS